MPDGPAWSLHGTKRGTRYSDTPGPGEYNIPGALHNRTTSFGAPTRAKSAPRTGRQTTPGPGAYGTGGPNRGPAYSMAGKHGRRVASDSPGPGAYAVNDGRDPRYKGGPAWSLYGKPQARRRGEDRPGPGAYNHHTGLSKKGGYMGDKHARAHVPLPGEFTPGPGAYDHDRAGKGLAFSITGKPTDANRYNDSPGPGAYSANRFKARERNVTHAPIMTKSGDRFHYGRSDNPGPGHYGIDTTVGKAPAFSLSGRVGRSNDRDNVPGPGAYRPQSAPPGRGNSKSMGKARRFRDGPQGDSPGPGAYNLRGQGRDTKGFSMSGRTFYNSGGPASPGPGAYIRPSSAPLHRPKGGAMGRSQRFRRNSGENAPGPGAYMTGPGAVRPDKGVSLHAKLPQHEKRDTGEYLYPRRTYAGDHAMVGREEWGHPFSKAY
uniref:Uncharacterized protein n=1 Tax=Fibrocapsa japonica TaxID=94617 RepID=A0A7S2V3L7_9STRA